MSNIRKKYYKRKWVGCTLLSLGVIGLIVFFGVTAVLLYNLFGLGGLDFSKKSGFYNSDIIVELNPGWLFTGWLAEIRYNLDGDDLDSSYEVYNSGIRLEVPEDGYKVYTIKTAICNSNCTAPRVATYVLGKELDHDVTIDIMNINSSQRSLYDYSTGIMTGGVTYDLYESTYGNEGYLPGNYNNRGTKWMRDAHITSFGTSGELLVDSDGYIGISGGTSAVFDVKSIKVVINSENRSRTFRLHSGSQDQFTGNIRASVASRLIEESGFDGGTDSKRVMLFLNGKYYGVFNMQQGYSKQVLSEKYNLEKKNKIRKIKGSEDVVFGLFGIEDDLWGELNILENRKNLESLIDMDHYMEYYAIQILFNNTDWPMNNFEAWYYIGEKTPNNRFTDGRLRFLIYDTDLIYYTEGNVSWFDGAIGDIFEYLMEEKYNGAGSSFRKVMESEYYRNKFINLLRALTDGPFATENVLKIIDEEAAKIEHQVKLFSTDEEYEEWAKQIGLIRKAASEREGEIREDVKRYFGVEL